MGARQTGGGLGGEGSGGKIHGPANHSGCIGVDTLGGEDAADFGPVVSKVAGRLRNEEAESADMTAGTGHVVEARARVQMMAAASSSADSSAATAMSAVEEITTGANDQGLRVHRDLRKVIQTG